MKPLALIKLAWCELISMILQLVIKIPTYFTVTFWPVCSIIKLIK